MIYSSISYVCFVVNLLCYVATASISGPHNYENQAVLNDHVDIGMSGKPGERPVVTGSSNNTLWQSSDNATALYLHTNASGGGWGGVLELKRPGGGGSLGIKSPPQGGLPVVSVAGSTTLYESNGTSVGVNGMVDTAGNREGHMSIKRP